MQEIGEFRQMLLEQLASAEGMEALAQAAAAFLKEPFAVCDAAYTLMVTTAPHQNDGVFVVQSSQHRIMRPEIVEEMQNKGILERLQKSREAFSIYNTSCGMWEIFCVLAIHGQVAGYLFLRTAQEPDEARLEAWTTLGQALSVELQKGEYATPGPLQPIQSRILRQLMEGEISQENLILHRLRQTGWKPSQSYRLETQPKLPAGNPAKATGWAAWSVWKPPCFPPCGTNSCCGRPQTCCRTACAVLPGTAFCCCVLPPCWIGAAPARWSSCGTGWSTTSFIWPSACPLIPY